MTMTVGVMADSYNKPAAGGGLPVTAGLSAWYDASTLAGANGSRVTSWPDGSPGGRTLTGPGPVLTAAGLNGKTTAQYTLGSDMRLTAASGANHQHFFAVVKYDGATFAVSYPGIVSGSTAGNVGPDVVFTGQGNVATWYADTVTGVYHKDGVLSAAKPYPGPMNAWAVVSLSSTVFTNPLTIRLGMDRDVAGRYWNGGLAEVIAYNRVLSDPERQQVESYLTAKWITPAGFSPLSIPWHSAFWASDPSWIPPADGGAVSDWKNSGTCAVNATQATGTAQPTYRAAYANLNGKPAVEWNGTAGQVLTTTTPTIAQPNHIVAIGWLDPGHNGTYATITLGMQARHFLQNRGGLVYMDAPTAVTVSGAGRTSTPYLLAALFNGASSKCRMNGTDYTVSGTVGTAGFGGLLIGSTNANEYWYTHKGAIAFLGVSDTELTAQQITDLETWAKNYYGVPIP